MVSRPWEHQITARIVWATHHLLWRIRFLAHPCILICTLASSRLINSWPELISSIFFSLAAWTYNNTFCTSSANRIKQRIRQTNNLFILPQISLWTSFLNAFFLINFWWSSLAESLYYLCSIVFESICIKFIIVLFLNFWLIFLSF